MITYENLGISRLVLKLPVSSIRINVTWLREWAVSISRPRAFHLRKSDLTFSRNITHLGFLAGKRQKDATVNRKLSKSI